VTTGLNRYYGAEDFHFITCSCYQRRPLLGTAGRRDLFLAVLEQMRRRYRVVVLGYVVMPEHFHVLLSEPREGTLSTVMQALKLGFARRVLAAQRRAVTVGRPTSRSFRELGECPNPAESGPIWQARFYDFNVWSERKRVEKLRYMHRNPVKRGLVEDPDQWLWSSFRPYAYGEPGTVRINDAGVLEMKVRGRVLELHTQTA